MDPQIKSDHQNYNIFSMRVLIWGSGILTRWFTREFISSEISQTLRDFMENPNCLNTFCTNLKAHIILTPTSPPNRHRTRQSRKVEISQRIRTRSQVVPLFSATVPDCSRCRVLWMDIIEPKLRVEEIRIQNMPSVIAQGGGGNPYPEHAKRLTTYAKTVTTITFSLIVAFYTTKIETEENKMFILASFTSLIFALLFELVLVMLIGCVESPDPNRLRYPYEEKLYISIYGSNSLMMLTAFFLLLLCTFRYAYLAVFLILALLVITILFYQGSKLQHTTSIKKYREIHDSDLNHFSERSSAVVIMLFSGLSSIVFASPNLSRKNDQIKVTECFLYVIIVMSLLLMLLTSVPPAVQHESTRVRMVRVVEFLFYELISILTLVGLMAAGEILQGLVVFSAFAHIIGATYWLVTELLYEQNDQAHNDRRQNDREHNDREQNNQGGQVAPVSKELDSLSMVFATGAFSALMVVYSRNVDNSKLYSWWYFFILAVCMISLCSTFISSLIKMVIFSHDRRSRAWTKAEMILSNITYISLSVALLSTIVLAVYSGLTSQQPSN